MASSSPATMTETPTVEATVRARLKALREEKVKMHAHEIELDSQIGLLESLLPGTHAHAVAHPEKKLDLKGLSLRDAVVKALDFTGRQMRAKDIENVLQANGFKKTPSMSGSIAALLSLLANEGGINRVDKGLYESK